MSLVTEDGFSKLCPVCDELMATNDFMFWCENCAEHGRPPQVFMLIRETDPPWMHGPSEVEDVTTFLN